MKQKEQKKRMRPAHRCVVCGLVVTGVGVLIMTGGVLWRHMLQSPLQIPSGVDYVLLAIGSVVAVVGLAVCSLCAGMWPPEERPSTDM